MSKEKESLTNRGIYGKDLVRATTLKTMYDQDSIMVFDAQGIEYRIKATEILKCLRAFDFSLETAKKYAYLEPRNTDGICRDAGRIVKLLLRDDCWDADQCECYVRTELSDLEIDAVFEETINEWKNQENKNTNENGNASNQGENRDKDDSKENTKTSKSKERITWSEIVDIVGKKIGTLVDQKSFHSPSSFNRTLSKNLSLR